MFYIFVNRISTKIGGRKMIETLGIVKRHITNGIRIAAWRRLGLRKAPVGQCPLWCFSPPHFVRPANLQFAYSGRTKRRIPLTLCEIFANHIFFKNSKRIIKNCKEIYSKHLTFLLIPIRNIKIIGKRLSKTSHNTR